MHTLKDENKVCKRTASMDPTHKMGKELQGSTEMPHQRTICSLWNISRLFFLLLFLAYATPVFAQTLAGNYLLQGDSDGTVPKQNAVIVLTAQGGNTGTLFVKAVQPGQTLEDRGTYAIKDDAITIHFEELEWQVDTQPFSFDGCALILPFKALSGSPGPGTSTWIKQDSACEGQQTTTLEQAQTSDAEHSSATAASEDSVALADDSPNDPPAATPSSDEKESCQQCKYVPCIKSILQQKEEIVAALKAIGEQRKWGDLTESADDYFDLNTLDTQEKRRQVVQMLNQDRAKLWEQIYARLNPETSQQIRAQCGMPGGGDIAMLTDPLTCQISEESIQATKAAMPCKDLAEISYIHETYHRTKCLERMNNGISVLTPRGEAREEIAAYSQSITFLKDLLKQAESKCLWLCRCNQERYETPVDCDKYCPHARLGKCHAPTCVELDPKTQKWIPGKGRAF